MLTSVDDQQQFRACSIRIDIIMASPSTGVRSSKRKRAQVKYYESETSDHGDESCDDFISTDESPQAKKVRIELYLGSCLIDDVG